MFVVLFGPPGAGKGTQASLVSETLEIPHVSTGDIFRYHIKNNTELGQKVKGILASGALVSDQVVFEVLVSRLVEEDAKNGVLLDGYPRTVTQVDLLQDWLSENKKTYGGVLNINVSAQEVESRLTGRRSCLNCGETYHIRFKPPGENGECSKCDTKVIQRDDDKPEVVKDRIRVYENQTVPVLNALRSVCDVIDLDGEGSINAISSRIREQLSQWKH
jgi:adenylate kinase